MMPFRSGTSEDMPAVLALLKNSGLPHEDITSTHLADFLLATKDDTLLGLVGLERYGNHGLLRSLAVQQEQRGTGLGTQLVAAMEAQARKLEIKKLYLLTTTATDFFARRGYKPFPRLAVPPALQGSTEFSSLCPAQAVCLRKTLT